MHPDLLNLALCFHASTAHWLVSSMECPLSSPRPHAVRIFCILLYFKIMWLCTTTKLYTYLLTNTANVGSFQAERLSWVSSGQYGHLCDVSAVGVYLRVCCVSQVVYLWNFSHSGSDTLALSSHLHEYFITFSTIFMGWEGNDCCCCILQLLFLLLQE